MLIQNHQKTVSQNNKLDFLFKQRIFFTIFKQLHTTDYLEEICPNPAEISKEVMLGIH